MISWELKPCVKLATREGGEPDQAQRGQLEDEQRGVEVQEADDVARSVEPSTRDSLEFDPRAPT